ncbi:NADP-dependent oxidoreductase [Advenella mimigardefordensis]|uniref:Putative GroES-like domain-containing zinc-type alcohol dehydrogenase n=1 Tax=Advenella mimigardefordensis (strain DSM 17166 / LMG 22922 / DPN7) TaxID=1247726 RepID=W0PAC9_ADVMD|nr:NADP-dependent oxidoreductase [Advenella mimigardefordensis]AHG63794.1 putative GroES-like domain-containing zinc-type alcohol dehydrogenase [Advenella mimigardefordensis DPN7]
MPENEVIRVISRPTGIPGTEHFQLEKQPLAELQPGQIRVCNEWLSVDPAMRGWLADANNYASVKVGEVMRSLCVGTVIESTVSTYNKGDRLMGWFGWQTCATVKPEAVVQKITATDLPPSLYLGVLGLNGITAATALDKLGSPRQGDTVVVSTAAGGVGSCVGQLAKTMGCRTVGLTSSSEKVQACYEAFGYDHVINYKTDNIDQAIKAACPDGVNVYFDNTSGSISDSVMQHLAIGARVIVCGTASIPSWDPPPMGPRVNRILLTRRARMEGFILFDHQDTYASYVEKLEQLVRDKKLTYREHITDGLHTATGAIAQLYRGENLGKRLIRL